MSNPQRDDSNPLGIPRNVLAAARAAGLSYPLWYAGGRERDVPRKKTLDDLIADVERRQQTEDDDAA